MTGKYICIESINEPRRYIHTQLVAKHFQDKGINSIVTSELENKESPITMELSDIAMGIKDNGQHTLMSREYIFQAIRNINLETVVLPSLKKGEYVITNQGILSGYANNLIVGIPQSILLELIAITKANFCKELARNNVYDIVILLEDDPSEKLKSIPFPEEMKKLLDEIIGRSQKMMKYIATTPNMFASPIFIINTAGKSDEQVQSEIVALLQEKGL